MKTKERILLQSLELFNEEGEGNVSAVDIANTLDISPGNLYYHYKGKEPILAQLLAQYSAEIAAILNSPEAQLKTLEQHWLYLYVVAEEVYRYRFFYRNITELLQRFPSLHKPFTRLARQLENGIEQLLHALRQRDVFELEQSEVTPLGQSLCLVLTQWFNYNDNLGRQLSPSQSIHSVVYQLISLCLPHLAGDQQAVWKQLRALYQEAS
ncbi:MAG: TetR/AcrR family transcriptional regulator [Cellvibrionaceae bacterium]|nr:TetR/AcrR family transcriptional regulator [Cellvibrionaceae bacterium]MCV6625411.1 TetR/AcrR family transcriptional regulator [Cellvibrionaceae bacterium]